MKQFFDKRLAAQIKCLRSTALIVCCCFALCSGCFSSKLADQYSHEVVHQTMGTAVELPYWASRFRAETSRWPDNYQELSHFVSERSAGRIKLSCQSADFRQIAGGGLEIDCLSSTDGATNRTTYRIAPGSDPDDHRRNRGTL